MLYMIKFFLQNGFASRRTVWMGVLSLVPPAVTVLLALLLPHLAGDNSNITLSSLFPRLNYHFYLHFLLPLITIFIGTSVLRDEVEERTLSYLLTRPLPRGMIIFSKMLAGIITAGLMLFISLMLTWLVMLISIGGSEWVGNFNQVIKSSGIIMLGLLVYLPLFTLIGGILKQPVLISLLFSFGWEGTVAVMPGNIKLLTVAHYLHVLSPPLQKLSTNNINLFNFVMPTAETSHLVAYLVLIGCFLLFAGLASTLLYIKEYRLQQE